MYVCGRGTKEYGTILPSVYQFQKRYNSISSITVVYNSLKSKKLFIKKNTEIEKMFKLKINIIFILNKPKLENILKNEVIKFDCAIVAIPDSLHFSIIKKLLIMKINVLTVKPFVTLTKDAKELIKINKQNKLFSCVEFHKRYDESNIFLYEKIKDDYIGNILYCLVEYSQKKIIPEKIFLKWSKNTSIFQYLGVHYVDLIGYATNFIPYRVMAIGQKKYLKSKKINTYDSIEVIIEWKKNNEKFTSIISTNWIDPNNTSSMSDQKIKFIGTKGRIELDQKNRGVTSVTDKNGIEDINLYFSKFYLNNDNSYSFKGYGYESIKIYLNDIFNLKNKLVKISDLDNIRPTFKNCLTSVAVQTAVDKSLDKNNQWIKTIL